MTILLLLTLFSSSPSSATPDDGNKKTCESLFASATAVSRETFQGWMIHGQKLELQVEAQLIEDPDNFAFHWTHISEINHLIRTGFLPVGFLGQPAAHAMPFDPPENPAVFDLHNLFLLSRMYAQIFARLKTFLDELSVHELEQRQILLGQIEQKVQKEPFHGRVDPKEKCWFSLEIEPNLHLPADKQEQQVREIKGANTVANTANGYLVILNQKARNRPRRQLAKDSNDVLIGYGEEGLPADEIIGLIPLSDREWEQTFQLMGQPGI